MIIRLKCRSTTIEGNWFLEVYWLWHDGIIHTCAENQYGRLRCGNDSGWVPDGYPPLTDRQHS